MVSPARRRRAWIMLVLTWAVIAGVLINWYFQRREDAAAAVDARDRDREALARIDRLLAEDDQAQTTAPLPEPAHGPEEAAIPEENGNPPSPEPGR